MSIPSLPLFPDAYFGDTKHLSCEQHGAYLQLLMIAWKSPGCSIRDDDASIARMISLPFKRWKAIKPTIMGFWDIGEDGCWRQKRLTDEHRFVSARIESSRAAGKLGGRPKSLINNDVTKATGFQEENLEQSQTKAPNPNPNPNPKGREHIASSLRSSDARPKRKRIRTQTTAVFNKFWSSFPTDALMSKKAAAEAFARLGEEDQLAAVRSVSAFKAHCQAHPDYRPVHAVRYLSQRRFDGFARLQEQAAQKFFVVEGTPQFEAWRKVRGSVPVVDDKVMRARGWWFDSEWPNGAVG